MRKKIIAFGYVNLSDHWASLFHLDQLYKAGFEISYLNIDPVSLRQNAKIVNNSTYLEQIIINDIKDFESIVKRVKDEAVFIPSVTIGPKVWSVFKILLKEKAFTCYIHVGEFLSSGSKHTVANFKRRLKKVSSKTVIEKLFFPYQKRSFISNLRIAFVAGSVAEKFHRDNGCKNIININVRDYDDVMEVKTCSERLLQGNYCVFLDGFLPYHHDNKALGFFIEPEGYYRSLNRFFDYIEDWLKLQVVVAAHPKSEYERIGNKFNGRNIIKGKTIQLMKDAELILNNDSFVGFCASTFNKPMVFLTNNNIDRDTGFYGQDVRMYADILGCQLINVDQNSSFEGTDYPNISVNKEKYNSYKYKYLTSVESENKRSKDIILDELKKH